MTCFSTEVRKVISSRLGELRIRTTVIPVGSHAWGPRPKTGDLDVLIIVDNHDLMQKVQFDEIIHQLRVSCSDLQIQNLELRHGPFKTPRELQLHALLHTSETFQNVSIITRWVWSLSEFGEALPNELFSQSPSGPLLRTSCAAEIEALIVQAENGDVRFKEWKIPGTHPTLVLNDYRIQDPLERKTLLRYAVLAAASDLAAAWNVTPENFEWFTTHLPSNTARVVKALRLNSEQSPTVVEAGQCLKDFYNFLLHQINLDEAITAQ